MKPHPDFLGLDKRFWANVKVASEFMGYSNRRESKVSSPKKADIESSFNSISKDGILLSENQGEVGEIAKQVSSYLEYRAQVLNDYVEPRLMDVNQAKNIFEELKKTLKPNCPLPMNKQKGDKKAPAYFTGIINMLIETNINRSTCNYDPQELIRFTKNGIPVRALSRRVDGAYPSLVNPVALWEIKEYYYTTTFGSRVADGIYETLLDGMEIEELKKNENINVFHYLMIDAHYTWWISGKSYLCRIVDLLQMGYIDEVFFGHEVIERLPEIIKNWVKIT